MYILLATLVKTPRDMWHLEQSFQGSLMLIIDTACLCNEKYHTKREFSVYASSPSSHNIVIMTAYMIS